jgi:hypothetical protein
MVVTLPVVVEDDEVVVEDDVEDKVETDEAWRWCKYDICPVGRANVGSITVLVPLDDVGRCECLLAGEFVGSMMVNEEEEEEKLWSLGECL